MNNLLQEREELIVKRKRTKKHIDNVVNLSVNDSKQCRLLDEGAVVVGEDNVRWYLAKGTIDKFMNSENEYLPNIDSEYKGFINIGHADFAADPTSLIGSWTKEDLSVVDIGKGRKGLDVEVNLWDWHPTVELLHKLPYEVAVSAEFYAHTDYEESEKLGFEVIDEICVTDFAVVGNGANVFSNGLMLKGEEMKKDKKELFDDEVIEEKDEIIDDEEVESDDEVVEESDETIESDDEEIEESDEASEEAEEKSDDESEVSFADVLERIESLQATVDELSDENEILRDRLEEKEGNLKEFADKFKTLSAKINPALKKQSVETTNEENRYGISNDGIGV